MLPLSENGIRQVNNVKDKLNCSFNSIFSSPSLRCMETANIINNSIPHIIDVRLLEKGYGNKKHDGNETVFDTINRFVDFLHDLKKYKDQNVLVVTHGGFIRLVQNVIEEKNTRRKHINNCDFIKYEKKDNELLRL